MQAVLKATSSIPPTMRKWLFARAPAKALVKPIRAGAVSTVPAAAAYSKVIYRGQARDTPELVLDEQQVFGSEVKLNPSQSEANVAADRGEIDPLPMGMHHTILLDAGEAGRWSQPTESEADVHADRYMDDPLRGNTGGYS